MRHEIVFLSCIAIYLIGFGGAMEYFQTRGKDKAEFACSHLTNETLTAEVMELLQTDQTSAKAVCIKREMRITHENSFPFAMFWPVTVPVVVGMHFMEQSE